MHIMTADVSDQIDIITEALIREHLSKKKLVTTLNAYTCEQPRHPQAISKRSILQQVLGLEPNVQSATTKAPGNLCTTVLEALVAHHLQQSRSATPSKPSQEVICSRQKSTTGGAVNSSLPADTPARSKQVPSAAMPDASKSMPQMEERQTGSDCSVGCAGLRVSGAAGPATADFVRQPALPGRLLDAQQQHSSTATATVPQQSVSQPREQGLPGPGPQLAVPSNIHSAARSPMPHSTSAGMFSGHQEQQLEMHKVVPKQPSRKTAEPAVSVMLPGSQAARTSCKPVQNEILLEDIDDEDMHTTMAMSRKRSDVQLHQTTQAGPTRLYNASTGSTSCNATTAKMNEGQPILPEQQRHVSELLWGDAAARPDAAWSQGFIFSTTPGLEWGLVQLAGGPCGVLAAVQGHLVATLMEQNNWGEEISAEELLDALVCSLAIILWSARSGPSAMVVMLPHPTAGAAARGLCDAAQITRSAQIVTATTKQQLEAHIRAAVPQYCARKGWGLLMLLYSLLLTRGCSVIRQDMDDSTTCLIDHHGYCSMELVNLLLSGAAVSNVFDGQQRLDATDSGILDRGEVGGNCDSHLLKGVACQARVGLLTLFEWYKYVEVGQNLKCPRLPVWVVCSESHFTMLALNSVHLRHLKLGADKADLGGFVMGASSSIQPKPGAAVVLDYYDGMGAAESVIKLILLPADKGGWSSKLNGITGDRGIWQGKAIPPLECVLETKWPDVEVAWQGSDPIL